MTEADAKSKWCPLVRLTADGQGEWHTNRPEGHSPGDAASYRCIGSDCMAWRHRPAQTREVRTDLGELPPGYHEDEDSWVQIPRLPGHEGLRYRQTLAPEAGYCGLAGAPQ